MMVNMLLLTFLPSKSLGLTQLKSYTTDSFSQFTDIAIEVPPEFEGKWMNIEASMGQITKSLASMTEFLFLAAEPTVALPTISQVSSHQNSLASYLGNTGVYFDNEGANALRWYQSTLISNVKSGTWKIGLYDMESSILDQFSITVRVSILEPKDTYCPESCNTIQSGGSNTCRNTVLQDVAYSSNSRFCSCGQGYIGQTCYFDSALSSVNDTMLIQVQPLSWQLRSFNLSSYSTQNFTLRLRGAAQYLRMAIVYGAASVNAIPSFWKNSFDIQQEDTTPNWQEYPVINDQISIVFNKTFLAQQRALFPYKDHNYDQTIVIGFYNYNPITPISIEMQLKVIDPSSSSSGVSQKMLIILVVLGGSMVLCIAPISYYFCKSKCKMLLRSTQYFKSNVSLEHIQNHVNLNDHIESSRSRHNQERQQQQEQQLQSADGYPSSTQRQQVVQDPRGYQIQNPPLSSNRPLGAGPPSSSRSGAIIDDGDRINSNTRRGYQTSTAFSNPNIVYENNNINNNNNNNNIPQNPIPVVKKVVPVTRETINKFMPAQLYSEIIKLYSNLKEECAECMVCLEGFELAAECRLTPCFHLFHSECLLSWFNKHSTCPYCRAPCNRKGIIQQLHISQRNTYVKRFESPRLDTAPYCNNKEQEEQDQGGNLNSTAKEGLKTEGNTCNNNNISHNQTNKSRIIVNSPMNGNNQSEIIANRKSFIDILHLQSTSIDGENANFSKQIKFLNRSAAWIQGSKANAGNLSSNLSSSYMNNTNKNKFRRDILDIQNISANKLEVWSPDDNHNNNHNNQQLIRSFEDCLSSDVSCPPVVSSKRLKTPQANLNYQSENGRYFPSTHDKQADTKSRGRTTEKRNLDGIIENDNNIGSLSMSNINNTNAQQQQYLLENKELGVLSNFNSPDNSFYSLKKLQPELGQEQQQQLNGIPVVDDLLVLDEEADVNEGREDGQEQ